MPDSLAPRVPADVSRTQLWIHKAALNAATLAGSRRVLRRLFPEPTRCYYDVRQHPGVRGRVALTLDDAFMSATAGANACMLDSVQRLLRDHHAHATFFAMLDGCRAVRDEAVASLLEDGHELGNHLVSDRPYHQDSERDFEDALVRTQEALTRFQGHAPVWFRAPHGKLSATMARVLSRHGLTHAMMDCYGNDPFVPDSRFLAEIMLRQATHGSILLLHMPERGYREWNLDALRGLLDGLSRRGLEVVTLSELAKLTHD